MAYTKYSLTPANNNAAPPDGAPEGMLPSAVNDTMRDMMAQIRDCGDGIRGGTYTMTAPVITGGSINGAAIGASSASTGAFTTLSASSTVSGTGFSNYFASPPALGGTAAAAVSSTNLSYTGTLTGGTGVVNLGSGQFYKDASGNVGIGTSSPTATLAIATSNNFPFMHWNNSSNTTIGFVGWHGGSGGGDDFRIGTVSTKALAFQTNNTERMRIDSSGRVLIGSNSAVGSGANLQVIKSSGDAFIVANDATNYGGFLVNPTSSVVNIYATSGGSVGRPPMAFWTNDSERMRIDTSGNLLVGTTNNASISGNFIAVQPGGNINQGHVAGSSSGAAYNQFIYNGSVIGSITQSGTTATSYNTSSDYRLKENIAPMTGALDVVQQLKPVTYNWKADGSSGQGFIAHELQEVVPDCVTGEKDATRIEQYEITPAIPATFDEEGNELTPAVEAVMGEREVPVYQGIDTSFLVATLTAAIQEQQAMINDLKAEVAALKAA